MKFAWLCLDKEEDIRVKCQFDRGDGVIYFVLLGVSKWVLDP